MTTRRLFLDRSPGETRGLVLLEGRPERLWIERDGDASGPRLGERHRARVEEISPGLGLARLQLGGGLQAALPLSKAVRLAEARVHFKRLTGQEIEAYLASGEWEGKAGAYAIQGRAGGFVIEVQGSYSAIIGLPLYETRMLLEGLGWRWP